MTDAFKRLCRQAQRELRSAFVALDTEYAQMVQRAEQAAGRPVPCKAGCSACCRNLVTVHLVECLAMLPEADADGTDIDASWVTEQADLIRRPDMDSAAWMRLRSPCAFLREDMCSAYAHRPHVCRVYGVMDDPRLCESVNNVHMIRRPSFRSFWGACGTASENLGLVQSYAPLPVVLELALVGRDSDTPEEAINHAARARGIAGLRTVVQWLRYG